MKTRDGFFCLLVLANAFLMEAADAQNCTALSSVPAYIRESGNYCLTQNLRYEGAIPNPRVFDAAIYVLADNVTIDFNGFTLEGGANAASSNVAVGVLGFDLNNVIVRNGTVRNFGVGVELGDGGGGITPVGYLVENMVVNNTLHVGISVRGDSTEVRDSRVSNVTASATYGGRCFTMAACGIYASGNHARVVNNSVTNVVAASGEASGIVIYAKGSLVANNVVSSINPGRGTIGITADGSNGSVIRDNFISNAGAASAMGNGIYGKASVQLTVVGNTILGFSTGICLDPERTSKYRANSVMGSVFAGYLGGTNIGGNSQ